MLDAPPRNDNAMPSPIRMRGTARSSVAEEKAYQDPKEPFQSALRAARASYPASCRPIVSTANPRSSAASGALAPTGHHQLADRDPRCARRRLQQRAPRHDDDPIRQLEHLVEIAGVEQHRRASRGGRTDPVADRLRGADVEPPRR